MMDPLFLVIVAAALDAVVAFSFSHKPAATSTVSGPALDPLQGDFCIELVEFSQNKDSAGHTLDNCFRPIVVRNLKK